jgi:hypothetical protein
MAAARLGLAARREALGFGVSRGKATWSPAARFIGPEGAPLGVRA